MNEWRIFKLTKVRNGSERRRLWWCWWWHNMHNFTKADITLSSRFFINGLYFIFPLIIFYRSITPVFSSFVTINRMTGECKRKKKRTHTFSSIFRWNVQRFDVLMEKSTRPCNFIYFSRSKWFCWTSMWLYMFSLHPSIIPGRRQCISSLCLSFDNLQCQISSMLTWWKVSSICYIVLFGFTTSALHFICPLFVDFDFCFYDLFSFSFLFQLTQSHFVSFDNFFFSLFFDFDVYKHGFPFHSVQYKGHFCLSLWFKAKTRINRIHGT